MPAPSVAPCPTAGVVQSCNVRSCRRTKWEAAISPSSFELTTPDGVAVAVWSVTVSSSATDTLGRAVDPSATRVLRRIVQESSCDGGGSCRPATATTGRWVCPGCAAHWSATATPGRAMVSRSALPCGIDVERAARRRPAAFRAADRWCATPVRSARQWTQAEAIYKAARPVLRLDRDVIPIPMSDGDGWHLSADSSWWVYSRQAGEHFVWTVVVASASPCSEI